MYYVVAAYWFICFMYAVYLYLLAKETPSFAGMFAILFTTLIAPAVYMKRRAIAKVAKEAIKAEQAINPYLLRAAQRKEDDDERLKLNYPTGCMVIVKSNEDDEPFWVGEVTGHMPVSQAQTLTPVVRKVATGEELIVFGKMHYYSKGKAEALNKLTPREQWNVMAEYAAKD